MNWSPDRCEPGDMIRANFGVLYHYGIFVNENRIIQFGPPPVAENNRPQNEIEVMATNTDAFACGRIIETAHYGKDEAAKKFSPEQIIERAEKRLGEKGYNILHNNCEHFANECVFGVHYSSMEDDARRRWNSRPILDVYVSKIDGAAQEAPVYPQERQADIDRCSNPALKASMQKDWEILGFALMRSLRLDIRDLRFEKTRHGKWLCEGAYFSLSHSKDAVAVAVSNKPVGVDIEITGDSIAKFEGESKKLLSLRRKVCTTSELNATGETPQDFLDVWTRKEAIFKCFGTAGFSPRKINADNAAALTRHLMLDTDITLSVCGENSRFSRFYNVCGGRALPLNPDTERI